MPIRAIMVRTGVLGLAPESRDIVAGVLLVVAVVDFSLGLTFVQKAS